MKIDERLAIKTNEAIKALDFLCKKFIKSKFSSISKEELEFCKTLITKNLMSNNIRLSINKIISYVPRHYNVNEIIKFSLYCMELGLKFFETLAYLKLKQAINDNIYEEIKPLAKMIHEEKIEAIFLDLNKGKSLFEYIIFSNELDDKGFLELKKLLQTTLEEFIDNKHHKLDQKYFLSLLGKLYQIKNEYGEELNKYFFQNKSNLVARCLSFYPLNNQGDIQNNALTNLVEQRIFNAGQEVIDLTRKAKEITCLRIYNTILPFAENMIKNKSNKGQFFFLGMDIFYQILIKQSKKDYNYSNLTKDQLFALTGFIIDNIEKSLQNESSGKEGNIKKISDIILHKIENSECNNYIDKFKAKYKEIADNGYKYQQLIKSTKLNIINGCKMEIQC